MKKILIALLLSATNIVPAFAITVHEFEQISAKIFQPVIKEFDIPGLVVGITIKGEHYLYTYGEANREKRIKVTGDTLFELGSISKLFTVTMAALAEQQGVLNLQSPVSRYVPQLAGGTFDQVTLTDLATHTTRGLPLQVPEKIKTEAALMQWLATWQPLSSAPLRSYSNVSIGLLGAISAQALNKTYAQAAEQILFPLLGLANTYVNVPKSAEQYYAFGYSRTDNRAIRVNKSVFSDEAYGVKSTANDMLTFLDVSLGKSQNPQLREAVETTQIGYTKTEYYTQAMLWEQYPWPVGLDQLLKGNSAKMVMESQPVEIITQPAVPQVNSFMNKTGATNGFGAYVALLPSEEIGIVVLANRNYPNEERVKATYRLLQELNITK